MKGDPRVSTQLSSPNQQAIIPGAVRHPEWKRLFDAMEAVYQAKDRYTYDELEVMAGINIRSFRGRMQFYKFRDEFLKSHNVWFECDRANGYRIVKAGEHGKYSSVRVKRSARQMRKARDITANVDHSKLSEAQRRGAIMLASYCGAILQQLELGTKVSRTMASRIEANKHLSTEQEKRVKELIQSLGQELTGRKADRVLTEPGT